MYLVTVSRLSIDFFKSQYFYEFLRVRFWAKYTEYVAGTVKKRKTLLSSSGAT